MKTFAWAMTADDAQWMSRLVDIHNNLESIVLNSDSQYEQYTSKETLGLVEKLILDRMKSLQFKAN